MGLEGQRGCRRAYYVFRDFADELNQLAALIVLSVAHVHAEDVDACVDEFSNSFV